MTSSWELNDRSPLRVLEQSLHGGLRKGDLGIVCAGPGAGKTAFLVSVALDEMMRGGEVLHVAIGQPVERVRNYYDEILAQLAREEHLEDLAALHLRIEHHRHIHAYQENTFRVEVLARDVSFLRRSAGMNPGLFLVDGYDWTGGEGNLVALKRLARDHEARLWMSARVDRDRPVTHPKGYPEPVARHESIIDVLLRLKGADGTVHLSMLKDRDNPEPGMIPVDLNPTTLLLVRR